MKSSRINHYEKAFGSWLADNKVSFIAVDEKKRSFFGKSKIKSFDFIVYPPNQKIILAEVKGRLYKGTTLEKMTGFQCWTTSEDIESLSSWQKVFGQTHTAAFIFAYQLTNIDVDLNGKETYHYAGNNYLFCCITLSDYISNMKLRSPKWKTVTLPARAFRDSAIVMQNLIM